MNTYQLRLAHNSVCGKCGATKVDQQLGLEPTAAEHINAMLSVFRDVWRVLKPAGVVFLNYGDCYATSPNGRSAADTKALSGDDRTYRDKPYSTIGSGALSGDILSHSLRDIINATKAKDLCLIPNILALALRADGWWVRSEIIWGKANGMPDSSGVYRPGTAHEKIWMLAKSERCDWFRARDTGDVSQDPDLSETCIMVTTGEIGPRWRRLPHYYDAQAVKLPYAEATLPQIGEDYRGEGQKDYAAVSVQNPSDVKRRVIAGMKRPDSWNTSPGGHGSFHPEGREKGGGEHRGRSTYGRHTMEDELPETERRDKQRGHPRRHAGFNDRWDLMDRQEQQENGRLLRNYERADLEVWDIATQPFRDSHFATFPVELVRRCILAGCPEGGTVCDPFLGSGTTALVAARLGRKAIGIELNPAYIEIAANRITEDWMGEEERKRSRAKRGDPVAAGPLFA